MNPGTTFLLALTLVAPQLQESPASKDVAAPASVLAHFDFQRPGAKPDHWLIEIDGAGAGSYKDLSNAEQGPAGPLRPVRVGGATRERLTAGYSIVLTGKCETKEKNIANTGAKHLSYTGRNGDVWSDCTFNYSDDAKLNDVASAFEAIAETIQAGDRLKHDHRFDHLGLDAELDRLTSSVKSGYAIELQNIAPILQSIIDDDEIMAAARRKAKSLLDMGIVQASASAR